MAHVLEFLQQEGLESNSVEHGASLCAYADGPREPRSPAEFEWYLEFRFDPKGGQLDEVAIEKRLVGP